MSTWRLLCTFLRLTCRLDGGKMGPCHLCQTFVRQHDELCVRGAFYLCTFKMLIRQPGRALAR
jgi:hypothetical protein